MKIKDIQLKAIKTFRGHEGEELVQANVYFKNKKVGFYSDGDWGGPATLDVPKEVLEVLAAIHEEYVPEKVQFTNDTVYQKAESAVESLLAFADIEKTYKKVVKKHGEGTTLHVVTAHSYFAGDIITTSTVAIPPSSTFVYDDKTYNELLKEIKGSLPNYISKLSLFRILKFESLNDFTMESLSDRLVKEVEAESVTI